MPTKPQLAAQIQAARKKAGFKTLYALHKETGTSLATLQRVESGESSPTVKTLENLMNAIGWEVEVTFRPARKKK